MKLSDSDLVLKNLRISFNNEEGSDYGGVSREWLSLLLKDIFHPDNSLFTTTTNNTL
jgi:hypothetical protein